MSKLRRGDRVRIANLGLEGEIVEHRVRPDDVTYIPKPQKE